MWNEVIDINHRLTRQTQDLETRDLLIKLYEKLLKFYKS